MTNKYNSFDQLWEAGEKYNQSQSFKEDNASNLIDELILKANLYKALDQTNLTKSELENAKLLAFGELLLTLTHISLKDSLNVFKALFVALNNRQK